VLDLFEDEYLLENFSFLEIILHITLVDGFYRHLLARELVDAEGDLTKSTLADKLHKFVVIESCGWKLTVLVCVAFYELDQIFSFL